MSDCNNPHCRRVWGNFIAEQLVSALECRGTVHWSASINGGTESSKVKQKCAFVLKPRAGRQDQGGYTAVNLRQLLEVHKSLTVLLLSVWLWLISCVVLESCAPSPVDEGMHTLLATSKRISSHSTLPP